MINKNDLRFIKTEKLIRTTYMELLSKKKKNITVTELCKSALINKSTFYIHYETIENLHRIISWEKLHQMFSSGENPIPDFFTDTEKCINSIFNLITENQKELSLLFPDWMDMISPLENELISLYETQNINAEQKYILKFCIGGVLHLMAGRSFSDSEKCKEAAIHLSKKCCEI